AALEGVDQARSLVGGSAAVEAQGAHTDVVERAPDEIEVPEKLREHERPMPVLNKVLHEMRRRNLLRARRRHEIAVDERGVTRDASQSLQPDDAAKARVGRLLARLQIDQQRNPGRLVQLAIAIAHLDGKHDLLLLGQIAGDLVARAAQDEGTNASLKRLARLRIAMLLDGERDIGAKFAR